MKKIRILIYIIIIINIFISTYLIANYVFNKNSKNNGIKKEYTYSIELNSKILPENHYSFEDKIKDDTAAGKFYNNLYYFVKNIDKVYNKVYEMEESKLKEFYSKNLSTLSNLYHIENQEDFIEIIKQYKKIYRSGIVSYKTVRLLEDTYKDESGHVFCNFEIEYNNNEILNCKVDISKDKSNNTVIYFRSANEV